MLDVLFAEFIGTFVFLGIIITSGHATSRSSDSLTWIKIGLALSIAILLVGFISGGQLNPAVSLMLYMNKDITMEKMSFSICGQLLGAIMAYFYYQYIKKYYSNKL
jgi:glycerol uptake facilitator-like aquaporin